MEEKSEDLSEYDILLKNLKYLLESEVSRDGKKYLQGYIDTIKKIAEKKSEAYVAKIHRESIKQLGFKDDVISLINIRKMLEKECGLKFKESQKLNLLHEPDEENDL